MATAAKLTDFNVPYTARVFLCRRTSAPERMDLFSYMKEDARRNDPIVSSSGKLSLYILCRRARHQSKSQQNHDNS